MGRYLFFEEHMDLVAKTPFNDQVVHAVEHITQDMDADIHKDVKHFYQHADRPYDIIHFGSSHSNEFFQFAMSLLKRYRVFNRLLYVKESDPGFTIKKDDDHMSVVPDVTSYPLPSIIHLILENIEANNAFTVVGPIGIDEEQEGHLNSFVIKYYPKRKHLNIVVFEPHTDEASFLGNISGMLEEYIDEFLQLADVRDVTITHEAPQIGWSLQGDDGLCVQWAILMAVMHATNPNIPVKQLLQHMYIRRRMYMPAWLYTIHIMWCSAQPGDVDIDSVIFTPNPKCQPLPGDKKDRTHLDINPVIDPYNCSRKTRGYCSPPCTRNTQGRCYNPQLVHSQITTEGDITDQRAVDLYVHALRTGDAKTVKRLHKTHGHVFTDHLRSLVQLENPKNLERLIHFEMSALVEGIRDGRFTFDIAKDVVVKVRGKPEKRGWIEIQDDDDTPPPRGTRIHDRYIARAAGMYGRMDVLEYLLHTTSYNKNMLVLITMEEASRVGNWDMVQKLVDKHQFSRSDVELWYIQPRPSDDTPINTLRYMDLSGDIIKWVENMEDVQHQRKVARTKDHQEFKTWYIRKQVREHVGKIRTQDDTLSDEWVESRVRKIQKRK